MMNDRAQKLAIGCLLHDFGKLLYRYNDGRNHSTSGYDYLKNIDELREGVKEYMEFFNDMRPLEHLGWLTPDEFERRYFEKTAC